MIGKFISQYEIIAKIGEGGMGTVYLAHDTELDRRVALKFLPQRFVSDPESLARFRREAQIVAALNHPNIITIYEIGDHEGVPFIAMPYIEGEILSDIIARGPLSAEQVGDIVSQICAGLDRAHAAGIVHRDLKPGNILLDRSGLVKILDFGLAKVGTATRITGDHSTLGTVYYMSPEQARGGEVDNRSDIFSLGSVTYEMLTGHPPFQGDRPVSILYAIEHARPPRIRAKNRAAPEALEKVVMRMMAKKPADRYASAADIAADLPPGTHSQAALSTLHVPAPRGRGNLRATMYGAVALLLLLLAFLALKSKFASRDLDLTSGPDSRKMIAVLPFENLGAPEDEYFADGVTEEINSRLSTVSELGVISRTSTLHYKGTDKPIKEIGRELGVDYVLEGTVRWDRSGPESQVLITLQLIRVSDDTHLWTEQYDHVLDDLFRIQSEIATQVLAKLNVTLLASTRDILAAQPTDDFEAYQAYLRARDAAGAADYNQQSMNLGISLFERAVALDPEFAQAYAELSQLHSRSYHLGFDRTPQRLALARAAADRARTLAPDLPQTHLAFAYYHYWGFKNYPQALAELDAAGEATANDTRFLEARGYILRRQGDYQAAAENLERAFELSPRDPNLALEVANTHLGLWQFEQANRHYDMAIALAPDQIGPYTLKVRNQLLWNGDLAAARSTLQAMPASDNVRAVWFRAFQEFLERDHAAVIAQLSPRRGETYQTHAQTIPLALTIAWAHDMLGAATQARGAYQEALTILTQAREERPDDFRISMALGLVHAGLGDHDEAVRLGEQALAMLPMSVDAWAGPILQRNMAILLTWIGDTEAALAKIDYLLSFPNPGASPALIRIEPRFDRLREDPRLQEILQRHPPSGL